MSITTENTLITNKHVLICIEDESCILNIDPKYIPELNYIKSNFCGIVLSDYNSLTNNEHLINDTVVYLTGDIKQILDIINQELNYHAIKELSYNYSDDKNVTLIDVGMIPINIHNVGVYFRQLFNGDTNYFKAIHDEHDFQTLTESSKPGQALRKGIYLSQVSQSDDEIKFNLLRCSTNLNGPTDNFRTTDNLIINQVNNITKHFFTDPAELNHVLAQTYENNLTVTKNKRTERKAKISAHSDKTKDMPYNGLIAFTTFYKDYSNNKFTNMNKKVKTPFGDVFDHKYNDGDSVLTRLLFKLKEIVTDPTLVKEFSVTLYPNSVFIIPLLTNRLYTHEIKPSILPIELIPTRLGYVIRCSKTKAVYKDNQTYIDNDGDYIKLDNVLTHEGINKLKELYLKENLTDEVVDYGIFDFSLNNGDYKKPIV